MIVVESKLTLQRHRFFMVLVISCTMKGETLFCGVEEGGKIRNYVSFVWISFVRQTERVHEQ
jgi:hypothetical protein